MTSMPLTLRTMLGVLMRCSLTTIRKTRHAGLANDAAKEWTHREAPPGRLCRTASAAPLRGPRKARRGYSFSAAGVPLALAIGASAAGQLLLGRVLVGGRPYQGVEHPRIRLQPVGTYLPL